MAKRSYSHVLNFLSSPANSNTRTLLYFDQSRMSVWTSIRDIGQTCTVVNLIVYQDQMQHYKKSQICNGFLSVANYNIYYNGFAIATHFVTD